MRELFEQVQRAVDLELYYLALSGALIIPDVCSAMEAPDGRATKNRYIEWFNRHLGDDYGGCLTGTEAYRFRCSLLHQGRSEHPASRYAGIAFLEPNDRGNKFHCVPMGMAGKKPTLLLDLPEFARDVVAAATDWLADAESTDAFQANWRRFMQRRADGLADPNRPGSLLIGGVAVYT